MGEIWGLKPTLQLVILDRLESAGSAAWPELVTSLRHVGETAWKDLFESVSLVDRALGADPADAYWRMDFASRDAYRNAIAELAKHSARTEREVAEAAVELARGALPVQEGSRAGTRRSHVGYYLLDGGLHRLKSRIHYRAPLRARAQELALRFPTTFYLAGIEVLTFATVAFLISGVGTFTPRLVGLLAAAAARHPDRRGFHEPSGDVPGCPARLAEAGFLRGRAGGLRHHGGRPQLAAERAAGARPGARPRDPLPGQPRSERLFRPGDGSARFRPARRTSATHWLASAGN